MRAGLSMTRVPQARKQKGLDSQENVVYIDGKDFLGNISFALYHIVGDYIRMND